MGVENQAVCISWCGIRSGPASNFTTPPRRFVKSKPAMPMPIELRAQPINLANLAQFLVRTLGKPVRAKLTLSR